MVHTKTVVEDIHQSVQYAQFMKSIGWIVEKVDGVNAFIKQFPLVGSVIKIQRPNKIPSQLSLDKLKEKYRARSVTIEPSLSCSIQNTKYDIRNTSYLPTKTIHIDLKKSEELLFKSFSESTRRAIRRAAKNNVVVEQSNDIDAFIKLKSESFWPLGFLFTQEIKPLWQAMHPKNATLLLAKQHIQNTKYDIRNTFFAGILLLFYEKTAYYWLATSSAKGNSVAAPSLLVWEALKLSKEQGYEVFDFEGIYDERFPKRNKQWLGFTRFKHGFNGKTVNYPNPISV